MQGKLAVSIRRVHAEPECSPEMFGRAPTDEGGWLALWEDGSITYHPSARALLRAVRQRDQRDAARAERRGAPAIIATVITWNRTPPGFIPPTEDLT